MTQEEKRLLIKDLSARVFYGVKVNIERDFPNNPQIVERIAKDGEIIINGILAYDIYYYKPYLRPMSSMTEEEKDNLQSLHDIISDENYGDGYSPSAWNAITEWEDYCNSKHFDYRGLIPMGLALEAQEDMYKTE